MSETETTVPMDDKALFESAIANEVPEVPAQEAVTEEKPAEQTDGPARDEQGRFAAKDAPQEQTEQVAPEVKPQEQQPSAQVPAWRVSEIAEARRAAEARAAELERTVHQMRSQLQQFEKPPEPLDPFAEPEKFADQRARQAVHPVEQQMAETREHYSRKDAIRTHGQETVDAAFDWLKQADRSGDPRARDFIAHIKQSIDPFEEIVVAYNRNQTMATVGDNPAAYVAKEIERQKDDPEFLKKHGLQRAQPAQSPPTNIVKLPPSLNRQSGSAGNAGEIAGMDDMSLYQNAIR